MPLLLAFCLALPVMAYAAEGESAPAYEGNLPPEVAENFEAMNENLENIYYSALEKAESGGVGFKGLTPEEQIYLRFYNFYTLVRSLCPMIIGFSLGIGILVFALARKNKGIRRFALTFFIIGLPVVCLLFVFGIGILPIFKS